MTQLEADYLDAYKRLDAVCSDMFHDQNGVSRYIEELDALPAQRCDLIDTDRRILRRLRRVRNEIAHKAASTCTEEDFGSLQDFYSRLLRGQDALAIRSQRLAGVRKKSQPEAQPRAAAHAGIEDRKESRPEAQLNSVTHAETGDRKESQPEAQPRAAVHVRKKKKRPYKMAAIILVLILLACIIGIAVSLLGYWPM